jgi:hypothetical protein
VKKLESSKAFGYFAKGYMRWYLATGLPEHFDLARQHLGWLGDNYSKGFAGMSWGNAFDFTSRGGFIPRGWPTVVWTAHIAEAFDLAYKYTEIEDYRKAVLNAGLFVKSSVARTEDDTGICIGYGPGASTLIHNANLLAAVTLLRAWNHGADSSYRDLAKRAIDWSCARVNPDGSWFYGEGRQYRWIDNFHTAYNLDCLVAAQDLAGLAVVDQAIIDRTYHFWIHHFFKSDGRPKYYHDREYPVDIQCASQAVESLAKYADRDTSALDLSMKVAEWTIRNMQKRNGGFALRRSRLFVNLLESIHWGQSTMLSALGCLLWRLDLK